MTLEQMKVKLLKRGKMMMHRTTFMPDGSVACEDYTVFDFSGADWGKPIDTEGTTWYPTPEWAYAEAMGETPW